MYRSCSVECTRFLVDSTENVVVNYIDALYKILPRHASDVERADLLMTHRFLDHRYIAVSPVPHSKDTS